MVTEHFFQDNEHHPGTCGVIVPVTEAGKVVGTCCGYNADEHDPQPAEEPYEPGPAVRVEAVKKRALVVTDKQLEMFYAALVNAKTHHAEILGREPNEAEKQLLQDAMVAVATAGSAVEIISHNNEEAPATSGPIDRERAEPSTNWLTMPMIIMWFLLGAGAGLLLSTLW